MSTTKDVKTAPEVSKVLITLQLNIVTKPQQTVYKNYDCNLDTVKAQLDKYGVAVIPNVVSAEKCIQLRKEIWDEVSYVTKGNFKLEDQKTWKQYYEYFMPLHGMMLQHHSLGQMEALWKIRELPEVQDVFAKIWNVNRDKLIASFDALSIALPHEITNRGYYRDNKWMHTDQSSLKKGLHCIQGLVNLYPVNEGDATLTVYEGSHNLHEKYFIDHKLTNKADWYKLDDVGNQYFTNAGCAHTRVKAGLGSMVLWDSRTFHQGGEALKDRKEANFRMVSYVCMMPDALSNKIRDKRIQAFEGLRVTSHWPNDPKLFAKLPRTYGKALPEINVIHKPIVNDVRKQLIGYPIATQQIVLTLPTPKVTK